MKNIIPEETNQVNTDSKEISDYFDIELLNSTSFILNLPGKLRADKRLRNKYRLQVLVTEIFDLAKANGYAYCSNEYLAQRMGVSKETIKRDLKLLEDANYITRHTEFENFKRKRKIFVGNIFSNNFYQGSELTPPKGQTLPIKEALPSKKKGIPKGIPKKVANAPSPFLSFGEFKRVKLRQKDYDDLEKRFGKKKLEDLITAVDGNYEERGITRKNYKASIVNWERREKTFNPKVKKEDLIAKNREYAKNVVENLRKNFIPNEITFDAYATYFELGSRNHSQSKIISFSESGFKDQLENELRRRNALQYLGEYK